MSVFARALRNLRRAVIVDAVIVGLCLVLTHTVSRWWGLFAVYFALCLVSNVLQWRRIWKASQSPFAYLIEVEAACNGGKLK